MKNLLYLFCSIFLLSCNPAYQSRASVVQLGEPGTGACSGIQIVLPSGNEVILTAAHCLSIANKEGYIPVSSDNFRPINRKIIEVSRTTDLMLLEPLPTIHGITIASNIEFGEMIKAFTHGARFRTYSASGEFIDRKTIKVIDHFITSDDTEEKCLAGGPKFLVEELDFFLLKIKACILTVDSHVTTLFPIVGGSSGGGVVNVKGQLVGIVFAGDGTFAMMVRLEEIVDFLKPY